MKENQKNAAGWPVKYRVIWKINTVVGIVAKAPVQKARLVVADPAAVEMPFLWEDLFL